MELPSIPEILTFLSSTEPEMLEQMGEAAVLEAFRSAADEVPAYGDLLKRRGVDLGKVTDIESFRSAAPLLDKSLFSRYRVDELCRRGSLKEIKGVIPSSGHSGVFAFNVETLENVQGGTTMADLAFEHCLEVSRKPAFLINAYPMGLQVPTKLPTANTGVNADVALAIIKTFAPHYEQLIVVSQPLFAKKLIEDGVEQGVNWAGLGTTVVTGGEGFVESWRTYMAGLIGITDPDRPAGRFIGSSMGVSELAVNLFHEVPETMAIIRRAYRDSGLRRALFGTDTDQCPHLFVYYPMRTFIEEIPIGLTVGELVVSMSGLDNHMPFLRYRTGDLARIIPYRRLEEVLSRHAPDLSPPSLRLPLVAVFGRREGLEVAGHRVSAEQVKEALFRSPEVAAAVTGFFKAADVGGRLSLEVQLRPTVSATSHLEDCLGEMLKAALPAGGLSKLKLYAFRQFPYDVTYERKFSYLRR
jgi:phenylacetate-coenzyme A ligase PaaK-like adenylate-forming protein